MRILIAGGGQAAALVAARLIREGNEVVIVEQNPERCLELEEIVDAKVVRGNGASIRTLHEAGLGNSEMLIALTSEDQVNVLVCLIAQAQVSTRDEILQMFTKRMSKLTSRAKEELE